MGERARWTLNVSVSGPALAGALRTDPTYNIIYLGVDDVTASLAQVVAHGERSCSRALR